MRNIGLNIGLYRYGNRSDCYGDRPKIGTKEVCLCKLETRVEDSSRAIVKCSRQYPNGSYAPVFSQLPHNLIRDSAQL